MPPKNSVDKQQNKEISKLRKQVGDLNSQVAAVRRAKKASVKVNGPKSKRSVGGLASSRAGRRPTGGAHDHTALRYIACCCDPFSGPWSKGITGSHLVSRTHATRRRARFTIDFNSTLLTGGGIDVVLPLLSQHDMYMLYAYSTSNTWPFASAGTQIVRRHGFDGSANAPITLPAGSIARVVSAGVRITSLSSSQTVGGKLYFFQNQPGSTSELTHAGPSADVGALRAELEECTYEAPIPFGRAVEYKHPCHDVWRTVGAQFPFSFSSETVSNVANTALDWNAGGSATAEPHIRFWYAGPPQQLEIEVVETVELYHDSSLFNATPTITHPNGVHIHQTTHSALAAKSAKKDVRSLVNKISSGVTGVASAVTAGARAAATMSDSGWFSDALMKVIAAGETAVEIAALVGGLAV